MKNNKGITIIMLVITIIIILILTSFAVFYSTNIAPEAKIAAAFSSLKEIKSACQRAQNEVELFPDQLDEYYFFGKNIVDEKPEGKTADEWAVRCGLTSKADFGLSGDRTYYICAPTNKNDPNYSNMKRRTEKLELSNLNSMEFIVDLEKDKYYIVDGVRRDIHKEAYEYTDVELLYSMLTATKN
jgi:uncharacterized protein YpmB